jgi:CMP-N-acetylneuraminic acid synthetase
MPRKNLCEIEPGLSLVQQAVNCARHSGLMSNIVISSDDKATWMDATQFIQRPPELCGPMSDITDAVRYTTEEAERIYLERYDYVVTLQPAVLARSPLIVRQLVSAVIDGRLNGGLTMATTHRWIWEVGERTASNDWHGGPYPRSQDCPPRMVEINAVQVASRAVVADRGRWGVPLAILELPAWAAALDIDTPADLATARDMWPWAKTRLETWAGPIHIAREVQRCA